MSAAIPRGRGVLGLRRASIKEICLSEALRRLRTLWYTHIHMHKEMHTQSLHKNSFAKRKHFLSKPWNDWWLNMYTALHLTVKPYGNEWNQMEKHLRCNMKISKSSSPYLGNLTSTATDTHHPPTWDSAAQSGDGCHHLSTLSVSLETTPFISSTRRARAALVPYTHGGFLGGGWAEGGGGGKGAKGVCGVDGVQIK